MSMAELEFTLQDRYSVMIWNPSIIGQEATKSLTAEHVFSVIFSVYRDTKQTNKDISQGATTLLNNLNVELSKIETSLLETISKLDELVSKDSFIVRYESPSPTVIHFKPVANTGVCPTNASFLRMFIKFDLYVTKLGQARTLGMITDKEYFMQRKHMQSVIRASMESFNNNVKKFHKIKKNSSTSIRLVS